jgi:hypothetical protein
MSSLNSNKNVVVREQMAKYLLTFKEGQRIPPINFMKEMFESGTGTIQRAIKDLEESEAAIFESKQKQGTILKHKNISLLWKIANLDNLMILMPLPNSWEFQGLASGLRSELERIGVPFTILYTHGSQNRIDTLKSGRVDFVVLSNVAAEKAGEINPELKQLVTFEAGTYYAKDSVVIITRSNLDPFAEKNRIGMDPESYDHRNLTNKEFPHHKQFVNVSYAYLPQAILNGQIDCAIWHKTALGLSLQQQGLEVHPLKSENALKLADKISKASIVSTKGKAKEIYSILSEIDLKTIKMIQQNVINLKELPVY